MSFSISLSTAASQGAPADPEDMSILDGLDDRRRAELIAERLRLWKSIAKMPDVGACAPELRRLT
jgi:hypothetical protein